MYSVGAQSKVESKVEIKLLNCYFLIYLRLIFMTTQNKDPIASITMESATSFKNLMLLFRDNFISITIQFISGSQIKIHEVNSSRSCIFSVNMHSHNFTEFNVANNFDISLNVKNEEFHTFLRSLTGKWQLSIIVLPPANDADGKENNIIKFIASNKKTQMIKQFAYQLVVHTDPVVPKIEYNKFAYCDLCHLFTTCKLITENNYDKYPSIICNKTNAVITDRNNQHNFLSILGESVVINEISSDDIFVADLQRLYPMIIHLCNMSNLSVLPVVTMYFKESCPLTLELSFPLGEIVIMTDETAPLEQ